MTTAYAQLNCHNCGDVGLDYEEYMRQLRNPWAVWVCPKCGRDAMFDNDHYEATHLSSENEE